VRKDRLYCDSPSDPDRIATRQVMDEIFKCLCSWIAPILCFTADEAWLAYTGDAEGSIHLQEYYPVPEAWQDAGLLAKWEQIRSLRGAVMAALEEARNDGLIGGSLQAEVQLELDAASLDLLAGQDLPTLFITSSVVVEKAAVQKITVGRASGGKCARCWKTDPVVTSEEGICQRCDEVVNQ
jgi:isoleucyl-tRNA synthetase